MSSAYYVSVPDRSSSICTPAELAAWISVEWPPADIRDTAKSETYASEWRWPDLAVKISRDGRTVVMDGDLLRTARFIVWLRQRVSDSVSLNFFDESGTWNALARELGAEDIVRAFSDDAE